MDIQNIKAFDVFKCYFDSNDREFHETFMAKLVRWQPNISGGDRKVGEMIVIYKGYIFINQFYVAAGEYPVRSSDKYGQWRELGKATPEHKAEAGNTFDSQGLKFITGRKEGADPEHKDSKEPENKSSLDTVELLAAIKNNRLQVVKDLISQGAFPGSKAIHLAAAEGYLAVVKYLLLARPGLLELRDDYGQTPLVKAANNSSSDKHRIFLTVRAFVEAGADLDAVPPHAPGRTALQLALWASNASVVLYLVDQGADIELQQDSFPWFTPLVVAMYREGRYGNHFPMVRALLDTGAQLGAVAGLNEETPLIYAVKHCVLSIVKLLVEQGADVKAKDSFGNTAVDYSTDEKKTYLETYLQGL